MIWCRRLKPCKVRRRRRRRKKKEEEKDGEEAAERYEVAITVWACVRQVSVRNWASTLVLRAVFVLFLSASSRACRD
jgi:hypothetical protein